MFNSKLPHLQTPPEAPEEFISVEHEMSKAYATTHPEVVGPEPETKEPDAKAETD